MAVHQWGVDKSHFDSPTGTAAIVAEGYTFMTHKAGGDANDAELGTWWSDAKPHRADMLLGAYWVLYPGHGSGAGDSFIARLDSQCPGWRDGPFLLQLDCEEWGGNPATQPGLADIRACANRLRQLAPKLMPIVYAPKWAYGNSLAGLGYPLWSSSYTSGSGPASSLYPGDSYSGWQPYSGIVPSIAQFSSTGVVNGDSTTDVNAFKGTIDQLSQLVAPGWESDMAFTPDDAQTLLKTSLGTSGPTVAVALQSGAWGNTNKLLSLLTDFIAAEQTRDAAESAQITALTTLVKTLATSGGLTDEQVQQLIQEAADAAATAAQAATARLEAELQALRAHLGDTTVVPDSIDEASGLPLYDQLTKEQRTARQEHILGSGA